MAASVGWGRTFEGLAREGKLSVGVTAKFIRSKVVESASTGAGDAGILWQPVHKFSLAAAVQNVGGYLKFRDETDDLPLNIKLGSAYWLTDKLLMAADQVNELGVTCSAEPVS